MDVQLLGELLLERSNLKVMVRYVADEENLKLMMNLLKDQSRSIQFEAFHVFKVSVHSCMEGIFYCIQCTKYLHHVISAEYELHLQLKHTMLIAVLAHENTPDSAQLQLVT